MTTANEIVEAIDLLESIGDPKMLLAEQGIRLFEYSYQGCVHSVRYMGHQVWDSEDYTQVYDEGTQEYEPIYDTIHRNCWNFLKEIRSAGEGMPWTTC